MKMEFPAIPYMEGGTADDNNKTNVSMEDDNGE